mgnify:CR=1 FL=1
MSSFNELLKRNKSVSIHHRNLQRLAIEMYKIKKDIAPSFMKDIFKERIIPENSVLENLRSQTDFITIIILKQCIMVSRHYNA